jgi:CBS domain-containing protein
MSRVFERLNSLLVEDVMSREVVKLSSRQTMPDIADIFVERDISGAPVVDEQGRCVGILSAMDFVRRERALRGADGPAPAAGGEGPGRAPGGKSEPAAAEEDLAMAHMSHAVQSVSATARLYRAAQIMCIHHVHRLPVLDKDGRVAGLITAMDIVSAMINAIDEDQQFAS